MWGSEVVEVGIGMALLFLFASLIATATKEAFEGILQLRGKDLERGIRELLNDPGPPLLSTRIADRLRRLLSWPVVDNGQVDLGPLVRAFYAHPLINSLYRGSYVPRSRELPSYIPASNFSLALLDIAARGTDFAGATVASGKPLDLDSLRSTVGNIGNAKVQRAVLAALDSAGGDLDRARRTLELWFDSTIDRVSGWYRRRTQLILFLIGFAAAIGINIDAMTVAQRLGRDKSLRETVVVQAGKITGAPDALAKDVDAIRAELTKIGYPIGWAYVGRQHSVLGYVPGPQGCVPGSLTDEGTCKPAIDGSRWARTILGWLITALAIMLGAPFWLDVLNKFMVIRSTVKPREKSPEEGSEDRTGRTGK